MNKNNKSMWLKCLSLLMCLTLLISCIPLDNFSKAFAETTEVEPVITEKNTNLTTRTEIPSLRTANSKTYRNPDGTFSAEISHAPIHYKDEKNTWSPINNSLIENTAEGVYQNKANSFQAKFNEKYENDTTLLQIEDKNRSVDIELVPIENMGQEPAEVNAIVQDNSVQYPEIYENIDLSYTIGADRVKEHSC